MSRKLYFSVSDDLKKVRRNPEMPIPEMNEERRKELTARTIYAKGFPKDTVLDDVLKFFKQYDEVENIIMRRYQDRQTKKRLFKGSVFATFKTKEQAEKFLETKDLKFNDSELLTLWQDKYMEQKQEEYAAKKDKKDKKHKEKESVLRKGYLKEMIQVLSDPRYGSNVAQVDATVKKHEAISADILARTERFEDLSAMAAELVKENYHGAETVSRTEQAVLQRWKELLELLERHRSSLAKLAHLMSLLREADAIAHTLGEMRAQFQSEEVGRHLVDVERLLQQHALQELQLGALEESIKRLVRHGAGADGPQQTTQQLHNQLQQLEDSLTEARLCKLRSLIRLSLYKTNVCLSTDELPYLHVPLHTVIKLTPVAYGCREEHITLSVDAVDTHRPKPAVVKEVMDLLNQDRSPLCNTRPPHLLEPVY